MTRRGRFVVVEGLDGSGTSTQARALAEALGERGEGCDLHAEPTEGPIGRILRDLLAARLEGPVSSEAARKQLFALLFAADRLHHLERADHGVRALNLMGRHVVCARYVLSSLAYESGDARESAFVRDLNRDYPTPDLTVYLDCPVEVAMQRLRATRPHLDVFENEGELTRVRQAYESLLSGFGGRLIRVDATLPPAEITARVVERFDALDEPAV